MAKPIEQEWRTFCKACFSEHLQWTHPQQYTDLRRTFFGGARGMFSMVLRKISAGDEVTEADMQLMRDIEREFHDYAEEVRRGLA